MFGLEVTGTNVAGVRCRSTSDSTEVVVTAEHVVIASGGVCGGDLSRMRATWKPASSRIPEVILNGAHDFGDGLLHDVARTEVGASVTHLDKQWHYAAGVHHPAKRRPDDGLSLVPPRSALWLNALGRRIMNPAPLVGYTDTRHLVESIINEPGGYSWQVLNWKIAIKELAVSGCDYMTAFRNMQRMKVFRNLIFENQGLISRLIEDCPEDFIVADSLPELIEKMDSASGPLLVHLSVDRDRVGSAFDETGRDPEGLRVHAWIAEGPGVGHDGTVQRLGYSRIKFVPLIGCQQPVNHLSG